MTKFFFKKDIPLFIGVAVTAILITITAIIFEQAFLRILPLYISLIVASLQSRVNRYANLLGALNSILYGFVYIHYRLYGSVIGCFLISFPMQMITFIRWSKNSWGETTVFSKMTIKQRIFTTISFFLVLIVVWSALSLTDAQYVLLDSAINLLGLLVSVLTIFAYIEYIPLMIVNGIMLMILYISMLKATPEQVTYLIFSIYSLVCTFIAYFKAKNVYTIQQKEL